MATDHKMPNYIAIFWWLLVLTILEVAVIYAPMAKLIIVILLIGMALSKASLVAMYFMHLRFEPRALGIIALVPLILCVFLVLMLLPDHSAVPHKTTVTEAAGHSAAHE
ncbi:MAG: cytochrome C oxidase subunit IV family protein [candidate division NC10 bacterium]|jgi:cytochrome c oxidase subunit 4